MKDMKPLLFRHWSRVGAGVALLAAGLTACAPASSAPSSHTATVQVAYAGSLQYLNDTLIGPAFTRHTGYRYEGRGGGSFGIAHEIASKTIAANVFESIGYAPVKVLQPTSTRWAIQFAANSLVVAYNPKSPFAPELNAIRSGRLPLSRLFTLMAAPSFHLGRTNPNTDPQGQAFVMMIDLADRYYHLSPSLPAQILGSVDNSREIFSEEGILTQLQAGGLDAASAFLPEALERHLDYITLPAPLNLSDPAESSWYATAHLRLSDGKTVYGKPLTVDITTVGRPTPSALAFIRFVLGPQGQSALKKAGYTVLAPKILGDRSAVPSTLVHAL